MNRRDFAKSFAAAGLVPVLPGLPTTAAAPAYTPYMYGLGAHLARATGQCSPDMLMQKLRLAPEAARAMQAQLMRSGIVSAPAATGLATAVQPYMRSTITRSAGSSGVLKTAKRIADEALKERPEDQDDSSAQV